MKAMRLETLRFMSHMCGQVEIVAPNKSLISVNFPVPPKCHFFSNISKKHFRDTCTVGDAASKLLDLMQAVDKFELEMDNDHQISVSKGNLGKLLREDTFDFLIYVVWLIALVLNGFTILSYGYEDGKWRNNYKVSFI